MNSPRVTVFFNPETASTEKSPQVTSKQLYHTRNRTAFQEEKKENGDTLEDPVTLEEMPEYVPGETISYLRLGANNCPVGMRFFTLTSLQQCLAKNNKDPFTNQPWKGAMRRRVDIAVNAQAHRAMQIDIPSLFKEFIQDPSLFKATKPAEYALMHQDLHIGDAGILTTWGAVNDDTLRAKAIETLESSPKGSWLIRNASVKSTDLVTVQAISYVMEAKMQTMTQPPDVIPAKIRHLLVMHARGFGYAIVEAERNQAMPSIASKNVPLPKYDEPYGSFLDVMEWLHERAVNFKLAQMRTF